MCLTIPQKVTAVKAGIVTIKNGQKSRQAASLVSVKKGDWVLTQNNIIIKKITARQAKEINKLLK